MTIEQTAPIHWSLHDEESLLDVVLARPKANILDIEMLGAIERVILEHKSKYNTLKSVLFRGEGTHFSFGASVEEHQPGEVDRMLPAFHKLFQVLSSSDLVCLAAIQGQCLGGALELASFCHRVFAASNAKLGNPEIKLGVFAPVASLVLPLRIGQAAADDLLLTGRVIDANEALRCGLVDEVVENPVAVALEYHNRQLRPLSTSSLRLAVRAARHSYNRALAELENLERLYLKNLMETHDAKEGIHAFLQKRSPSWKHQ